MTPAQPADAAGIGPAALVEPVGSVLTRVARRAHDAIPGADGAGLTVFDHGRPDIIARSSDFVAHIDAVQYGIGEGPCITAAAEAMTIRSGALGTESRWPRFGPSAAALGVHSVLSLPLLLGDQVLGTMNVYAHRPGAFTHHAAEVGEQFAITAAVAVNNARVMTSAQRLAHKLSQALSNGVTIDQAIGVLIASQSLSLDEARARLDAYSEENDVSLLDAARRVLADGTALAHKQVAG